MELLLHIVDRDAWARAKAAGSYEPESLQNEGFIHCSTGSTFLATAQRYYKGRPNLVLLCIDPGLVTNEIKYEEVPLREDRFPHIYGPLNLDAVVDEIEFPCDESGEFAAPDKFAIKKVVLPKPKAVEPRLPVSDVKNSVAFYCEHLGFTLSAAFPDDEPCFALLSRDPIGIQLIQADAGHPAGKFTIWLDVEGALQEHERLARSLAIEWGPEVYGYGRREFSILDPDGHRIIFSEPADEEASCAGS
jgi:uncharacterized protein (DUF952 family)/catechol 2,3-dioxygenase-like lactoylglutathione lyase family enzyme